MPAAPESKTTVGRLTSRDVIDAVVDNMRQNLEELRYATLAPSRYTVYLSAPYHARIEGILPRLQAETARALDEELARLNRPSWLRRRTSWLTQLPGRRPTPHENAGVCWEIEFVADSAGELADEDDLIVHSDLVLAPNPELGVGERTRRITTVRAGDRTSSREESGPPAPAAAAVVHARLTFVDNLGAHVHDILRDQTTIGRGGQAYAVDIRVNTSEDVSREHARLRRDPLSGQFFLIDLSSLGTTLNGRHVPRGVEEHAGGRRENGAETMLPDRARIGLAGTVFIDFERVRP